jgi:hypothetical protein
LFLWESALGKVIFWIVVFFLVLLALRMVSVYKTRQEQRDDADAQRTKNRDDKPVDDSMVKCAACGVYIPKSTATMKANGLVCRDPQCAHRG